MRNGDGNENGKPSVVAVVFDWAGTTVDFGCCAPAEVFRKIFEQREVPVNAEQARGPMGTAKREHIRLVSLLPDVQERWQQRYGRLPNEADVDAMYQDFLPLQKDILQHHSQVIPGVVSIVNQLRDQGIRIASNTGYTKELMSVVIPLAEEQGYAPDSVVCSDEVLSGRPAPWMLYEALHRIGAYPIHRVVKVDDTPVGIAAGRNAGCWTVALTDTGNEMGCSQAEFESLQAAELSKRRRTIAAKFESYGADYVIESVANLLPVIEDISARLASGELPSTREDVAMQ